MDALILAAGRGSRLRHGRPKCLVEVGRRCLLDHQIEALRWIGVERIAVVVGYRADDVCRVLPAGTRVVYNARHAETNSLYSFHLARDEVGPELLVLNGDVLFHPLVARCLLRWSTSALAYDGDSGQDEEHMKVAIRQGALVEMSKELPAEQTVGENVGIIRLTEPASTAAFDAAELAVANGGRRDWLATAINAAAAEHRFQCVDVAGVPWVEIDFPEDLERARGEVLPAIERLPLPPAPAPALVRVTAA
jgi:choline kinase